MAQNPVQYQTRIRRVIASIEWLVLLVGIFIGLLLPQLIVQLQGNVIGEFLANLVPEAVGIAFTVAILDRLNQSRQERQTIEQLVRRAHSRHNHTALAAIEELRIMGALQDGALIGMELRGSNWRDANLYQADLRNVDLRNADLFEADLVEANLTGAIVSDEQLASCDIMYQATMPDGKRYDGRYKLAGDYALAERKGIKTDSPEHMAEWYGVSLSAFLEGEAWANQHLHHYAYRSEDYDWNSENNQLYE
jgi:hypothetical protein